MLHVTGESTEVGVMSLVRKLTPVTVTTPPEVVTAFSAKEKLTTGAAARRGLAVEWDDGAVKCNLAR